MAPKTFLLVRRAGRSFIYVKFRDPRTGELGAARSSGKTSEAAAIRWANAEYEKLTLGHGQRDMTLGDWARPFFSPDCPYIKRKTDEGKTYSAAYVRNSRSYVERFILPDPIALIPLDSLRRSDVIAWRGRLVAAFKAGRASGRVLQTLKLILNEAVYQELVDYSAASMVVAPAYEKHERTALGLDHLRALLDPGLYEDPRHWLATVLAAFTGMRASEVRALEWDALDFGRRRISVHQAFKDQSARIGPPKSGKGRIAPMSDGLAKLLLEWSARQDRGRWVFGFSENRPLGYKQWNDAVKKAAAAAGCPTASLHVLRHSLNTYLRGAGVSDEKLRASFGWSGAGIQDNYTHADKYDYSDQAAATDRILGGDDGEAGSDTEPDGGGAARALVRAPRAVGRGGR